MQNFKFAARTAAAVGGGQDFSAYVQLAHVAVLVVADGAGGQHSGAKVAQAIVDQVLAHAGVARDVTDSAMWQRVLADLDAMLARSRHGGEATVVVCGIDADGHCGGASVGDSAAWAIHADGIVDWTAMQQRKPLMGSGCAAPCPFFRRLKAPWTLLLGTDGLFNYVSTAQIQNCIANSSNIERAGAALTDAARLPSGALQDDIGLVIARPSLSA
jgi:serine/threonine protein phosphatase PrpC